MNRLAKIPVLFNESEHTYTNTETGVMLKGITSTLIHRLFPDKYAGIPEEVLAKAAERGSRIHEEIELVNCLGITPLSAESENYAKIVKDNNLRYLASEWTVSDLENYATNIDCIYDVEDGVVDIADYKTTSKFDNDSVSWQLSVCAYFLEMNNPNVKVRNLYGIWLRGEIAQLIQVERQSDKAVRSLIEADIENKPFTYHRQFPEYVSGNAARLEWLGRKIKELSEEYDSLKSEILQNMVEHNDKSFDMGNVLITMIAPTSSERFDSKAFKADNEELYKNYVKTTVSKPSLKITLR